MSDAERPSNCPTDVSVSEMVAKENGVEREDLSGDSEKEVTQQRDVESDYEPSRDSVSSQDVLTVEENKVKRASRVPQKLARKHSTENTK